MARRRIESASNWFHTHTHSQFSVLDAISNVTDMVYQADKFKQPAIALTDHGLGAGWVQLYKAGQKYNMQVFCGVEGYLTKDPIVEGDKKTGELERYHIGFLALNFAGYQELSRFMTLTASRPRFWKKFPRFDLNDLAALGTIGQPNNQNRNIAVTTGCYFGLVQQTLVHEGYEAAKRIVEMYARWFPHTFVELQNHNIDHSTGDKAPTLKEYYHDDVVCDAMYDIAQEVGLPVVISQDSHYLYAKEKTAHALMKNMVYGGDEGQNEFPGDSFHLASTSWVEAHHDPDHWKEGVRGCEDLLRLWDLQIPALDKYKSHIPTIREDPMKWLRTAFRVRLKKLEQAGKLSFPIEVYYKRGDHELDIVAYLNQAGYFSLWDWFVKECKKKKICIEARGSANNFLINWVLGITSVDPVYRKLLPERFLSKDRKKPPDIDMDIEAEWRDWAVALLEDKFGVLRIGTFGDLGAREGDDKGSVLVSYNAYLRAQLAQKKHIPNFRGFPETVEDVKRINPEHYEGLRILAKLDVKRNYGSHAAGLLLPGDDQTIDEYVPRMFIASSETQVSQFTQDDVDELGYTKMDILGQRTLTVLRLCQELIGREDPTDFSWIPDNDKPTCAYLSKGETENGIFQFEGYSMAKGARALKIRNTNDCIVAGALFRPACMDSGMTDVYLERRFDREKRKEAEENHPHEVFARVTKDTNGIALYQEQVLEIMRGLGMDYEGINQFFKIIKDSGKGAVGRNVERMAEVKQQWEDLCARNGIDDPQAAWHYIEGYTGYGFGKGHSTGYGLRSYRAAYLRTHYPLEFVAATLQAWAGRDKEPIYVTMARNMGIRLLPPDVNNSGAVWRLDRKRGAVRKGLSSIKGIGVAAAEDIAENAPYEELNDLLELCKPRTVSGKPKFLKNGEWTGNLLKLREAGALNSLGIGRGDE